MSSVLSSTRILMQMFDVKIQAFANEIDNDHMVWLFEIQHEANRIFSSDFSAEPELMPKTPSQKSNRRKGLSVGQNENRNKRRFSKGKRSNLRRSSVSTSLNLIAEDEGGSPVTREELVKPSRARRPKQTTQLEVASPVRSTHKGAAQTTSFLLEEAQQHVSSSISQIQEQNMQEEVESKRGESSSDSSQPPCFTPPRSPQTQSHITEAVVKISDSERQSAELQMNPNAERSPGRAAIKIVIAAATLLGARRSSVRHSLTVRLSLAGLRNRMTQESVRRASRRSFLKKKEEARLGSSTCSSNVSGLVWCYPDVHAVPVPYQGIRVLSEEPMETGCLGPETSPEFNTVSNHPGALSVAVRCFTRSMAQTPSTMPTPASIINKAKTGTPHSGSDGSGKKPPSSLGPRLSAKRRKPSPLKKSQSVRPNVRSFLHTVQKKQMLMIIPSSLGRSTVMKSFIKHTTPGRVDLKERERLKLEALKKKQEKEEERKQKMEEEKRRKQEEVMMKKRDERLRMVVEARVKEEQKEKKILQIDEEHDTLRVERVAEEKARKKVATKRQEELELRRRRRKKIQQAEEEEEEEEEEQERTRKMAEARLAMELEKEQETDAAERERVEREQAFALQREVESAAREKERNELFLCSTHQEEQQRQAEEERHREAARQTKTEPATTSLGLFNWGIIIILIENVSIIYLHVLPWPTMKTPLGKGGVLDVTVDIKRSPQSYEITPKGGNKPVILNTNPEDYGMDQNSEDSTDDESAPRKPIPKWAKGDQLKQSMKKQYFNPTDVDCHYGEIEPPMLDHIFYKNKPRYLKRTSSGIWHSPPKMEALPI
uniref:Inner centromere protein ARK-binding domain-containing protein n=1 Tax=Salmo trutta TaxID=8032 RepID=A0A673ZUZ1_SALTR